MMSSLYIGASGMKTHGEGLGTIGNNLANVNTVGYKQQSIFFADLASQELSIGATGSQGFNQLGLGSQVGDVRTLFTQGAFEPGNAVTDLSIGGKGFFQVTQPDGTTQYTRAGNFRFTTTGLLNDPTGFTLTGVPLHNGQANGELEPIKLDADSDEIATSPARATSQLTAQVNLGSNSSGSNDPENPYFSLLNNWNATRNPPLATSAYSYNQPMTVYDAEGTAHEVNVYFDGAPSSSNGEKVFEYVVATNPENDGSAAAGTPGAGLLMSGTLTFSSSGELKDMTGFTPSGANNKDLTTWTPAPLVDGLPQFTLSPPGKAAQAVTLDLGVQNRGSNWGNPPANAAAVGLNAALLPTMQPSDRKASVSTAYAGVSNLQNLKQNGVGKGDLMDLAVTEDGILRGVYSNNETVDFYKIPLFRFTSEDGLRHEGMNHYSAPEEVGQIEYGDSGTSNYGDIISSQLEVSNVDMSREMVNMITVQRGFQMNSKTVTTADTMLQKALELKRN